MSSNTQWRGVKKPIKKFYPAAFLQIVSWESWYKPLVLKQCFPPFSQLELPRLIVTEGSVNARYFLTGVTTQIFICRNCHDHYFIFHISWFRSCKSKLFFSIPQMSLYSFFLNLKQFDFNLTSVKKTSIPECLAELQREQRWKPPMVRTQPFWEVSGPGNRGNTCRVRIVHCWMAEYAWFWAEITFLS